jgi:hypothetical protein
VAVAAYAATEPAISVMRSVCQLEEKQMSPLFGHTGNDQADDAALPAEVSRLNSLSVVQLATEVMTKGFWTGSSRC